MGSECRAVRTDLRRSQHSHGKFRRPASGRVSLAALGVLCATLSAGGSPLAAELERTPAVPVGEGGTASAASRSASAPLELTVPELLERVLERSAQLKLSSARTAEAQAEVATLTAIDPAVLSLKDKGLRTLLLPAQEWEFNLKLKTPRPRALLAERATAHARLKRVEAEALVERQVLQSALVLWIEDLRLTELGLEVAHRVHSTHIQLRQLAEEKAQQALTTRVAVALAALDESESAEHVARLQAHRAAILQQLEARLGLGTGQALVVRWPEGPSTSGGGTSSAQVGLRAGPELPAAVPASEQLLSTALEHRTEVGVAARELEEAEAELAQEQTGALPAVGFVEFSYRLAPLPHAASFSPVAVSAGLELPLPGLMGPGPAVARAAVSRARLAQDALKAQLLQDLVDARSALIKALTALETFRAGPMKAAAEASAAVTEALTLGRMEISDAVRIQERTTRVLLTEVQLIREAREAYLNLLVVTGEGLPPEYRQASAAHERTDRADRGR